MSAAPKPYGPRKGLVLGKPNTSTAIATAELKAAYAEPASLAQMDVKPIPAAGAAALAPAAGIPRKPVAAAAAAKPVPAPAKPAPPKPFAGAPPELKPAANRYVPAGKIRAQIDKVEGKQYTDEGELLKDEAGQLIIERKTNPIWYKYEQAQLADETNNPYYVDAKIYMPPTRMDFTEFIYDTYRKTFTLPRQGTIDKEAYVNACKTLFGAEGGVKSFLYQEFVREYIRQASPYRGILVYHGLGSGKTCSSIAAAEALYGIANKRIIVMTPFSLRANFINEISFCGFRHYQLNNHWVALNIGKSASARVYARSVLGLGDAYVTRLKEMPDEEKRRIWLPDFSKEPNYKTLTSDEQSEIRAQINEIISNRIAFVNYNGVPYDTLNEWACTPGVFDNAVIVVDEIHNLVRLMQGSVDKFLAADPANPKSRAIDPVRPGVWEPLNCEKYTERELRDGSTRRAYSRRYNRGILFYRLLAGARNSKIIGLSGTPIINFPEELGILSNILAGYIDCVNVIIRSPSQEVVARFAAIAHKDPRIDIVRMKAEKEAHSCLLSVFPEGYVKVEGADGSFLGVKYDEDAQEGISAVYARVKAAALAAGIPIAGENFVAYPRLPPDAANFRKNFVSDDLTGITNKLLLKKRLTGIISYYKGSKEEYMPRINKDVEVECPMSNYALQKYTEYRKMEIEEKGTEVADVFGIGEEGGAGGGGGAKKAVSSYRFKTRAACNFVFPKSIERPLPGMGEDEIATLPDLDVAEGATDAGEDAAAAAAVEEDEAAAAAVAPPVEEAAAGAAAGAASAAAEALETLSVGAAAVKDAVAEATGYTARTYKERLTEAMKKLYDSKDIFMKLDGETEEGSLKNYSAKLDAMLRRIEVSPGSNLVYSQFSTVEGLGVLSIALQANGYKEIRITGSALNPQFTPEAEASIRKGPGAEKRYITFTGEGTKEQRALVLNIFNGNIDKLPGSLATVLKESGYEATKNLRGELCWVIGITGAGAEGISLKCCRSVHIFEPYWNMVRLDQVKGRAIRICSHADLPYDERTVDIYTYITTFSEQQLTAVGEMHIDYQIQMNDKNRTTDQIVLDICKKKDAINKELLTVMKEVAIDCTMNAADNEPDLQCFDITPSKPGQYMFDPDIEVDKQMTAELEKTRAKTIQSLAAPAETVARETGMAALAPSAGAPTDVKTPFVMLAGIKYYVRPLAKDPDTLELFDSTDTKLRKAVGTITKNPATGKYKRPVMFAAGAAAGAGATD
jgi:hypothetical protein